LASPPLAPGVYTVRARQADAAGNTGTSGANTFTIRVYVAEVLSDAPVGYWRLGELFGTVAANEISAGSDGMYAGQCTLGATGALAHDTNTGVFLNGTSALVSVPADAALEVGDGPLTVELWLKRARTNREEIVLSKGAGGYEIAIAKNGFVELRRSGAGRIAVSTVKISDTSSWHYLVITKSGASVAIYLDGVDVTGRVTPSALSNTGLPLSIGGLGSSYFNGSIDEVAVYRTALAASRIQLHFAAAR
jgi:Concanavalin A-like lectin/glucanases superfamily